MNKYAQACRPEQRMSNNTLLAILDSRIDYTQASVMATGETIDLAKHNQHTINYNIYNRIWIYYEQNQPRRMLLINNNWNVVSFIPSSRKVCVKLESDVGTRVLNFTVPIIFN
jgi:uncharacterized membrane protein